MSRILVTGASGFVGRSLVHHLIASGHSIRAATRAPATMPDAPGLEIVHHGDYGQSTDWQALVDGIDIVVHLAGIAHVGPGIADLAYRQINHHAAASLAEAAARGGVHQFILMSSIRAQTGATAAHVLTETDEPTPVDSYGQSKLAAEAAVASSGVPSTILRPVLVYGPNVKGNMRTLLRLAAIPIPLPFANFTGRRSLLALDRLLDAITHVLGRERCLGETFIVADLAPPTLAEIVSALRKGLGRPPGLLPFPAAPLGHVLSLLGRPDVYARLNGSLIVDPAKLIATGWSAAGESETGLSALAAAWRRDGRA